jgi:hypothetical protein
MILKKLLSKLSAMTTQKKGKLSSLQLLSFLDHIANMVK